MPESTWDALRHEGEHLRQASPDCTAADAVLHLADVVTCVGELFDHSPAAETALRRIVEASAMHTPGSSTVANAINAGRRLVWFLDGRQAPAPGARAASRQVEHQSAAADLVERIAAWSKGPGSALIIQERNLSALLAEAVSLAGGGES